MSSSSSASALSLPPSLWAKTAEKGADFPALEGDATADVAVVGAGFTGLSSAVHVAETGASVVVLDAGEPGWGGSGRTGGQVIPGLKYDPDVLERMFGSSLGPRLVTAVGGGPDLVFRLIERFGIRCDAQRNGWIQPAHGRPALAVVEDRCRQWAERGADVRPLSREDVAELTGSPAYVGGWLDKRGGAVQPLSYARGLARAAVSLGARVHGGSRVQTLRPDGDGWELRTPAGRVKAGRVVLATNAYTDDLWPGLRRSLVTVHSFQAATDPLPENVRATIFPQGHVASDTRRLLRYFRLDRDGRLIMGGRGPFTDSPTMADAQPLADAVREVFPQVPEVRFSYCWAGKVAMTRDHLPHLHELAPGLYAGVGFNGRGVAMGTLMGSFLAHLALGRPREEVPFPVSPLRPLPFHALNRSVVRALVRWYRLRDSLEAA